MRFCLPAYRSCMEEPQLCVSSATVLGADLDDCPPQMDSDFNIGQSSTYVKNTQYFSPFTGPKSTLSFWASLPTEAWGRRLYEWEQLCKQGSNLVEIRRFWQLVSVSVWPELHGVSWKQQSALEMFSPSWDLLEKHHWNRGSVRVKEGSPTSQLNMNEGLVSWERLLPSGLGPWKSIQWVTGRFTQCPSTACFLAVGTQSFQESPELIWEAPSCCLAGEVLALHIRSATGMEELSQSTFLAGFSFRKHWEIEI